MPWILCWSCGVPGDPAVDLSDKSTETPVYCPHCGEEIIVPEGEDLESAWNGFHLRSRWSFFQEAVLRKHAEGTPPEEAVKAANLLVQFVERRQPLDPAALEKLYNKEKAKATAPPPPPPEPPPAPAKEKPITPDGTDHKDTDWVHTNIAAEILGISTTTLSAWKGPKYEGSLQSRMKRKRDGNSIIYLVGSLRRVGMQVGRLRVDRPLFDKYFNNDSDLLPLGIAAKLFGVTAAGLHFYVQGKSKFELPLTPVRLSGSLYYKAGEIRKILRGIDAGKTLGDIAKES